MGRLTRTQNGVVYCKNTRTHKCLTNANCLFCTDFINIRDKLAHYEDMEEAGRLIELPCAINTELYFVGEKADGTYGIHSTTLFTLDLCKSFEGQIGKGFYLTKEEAEAKLKELSE